VQYKIPLFYPYMDKDIIRAVTDTLKSRWIGQGPRVDEFEQAIGDKFNLDYPLMTNSGTSALELAYDLIDIQPGDEVITTPLTCTATNIPLLRRGAKLVWADINPDTLCIDYQDVMKKVNENTKAVVAVSLGGINHGIDEVSFEKYKIPVVHDAAQGIGYKNGDYIVYSFQAIKHFSTADGGLLALPNKEKYREAKLKRWFGIDRDKKKANDWQAYKEREMTFDIEYLGYKYQPTDIAASMGIEGLKKYDKILDYRKTIFDIYREELRGIDGLKLIDGDGNKYWLATLLVERRDDFSRMMNECRIETNLVQMRNDIYQIFGGVRQDLPVMNEIEGKYISIPINTKMTLEDAYYITKCIKKGW